jgi:ABC-type antimicrobial peptide transport system permease subunit
VVADFKFNDPRQDFRPVAFMPLVQSSIPPARYARFLEVRTLGDPVGLAAGLREVIREVDPNLPVTSIKTLTRQVDEALARESLIAGLSSFFAVLGLLLACVGLYGVLAYAVTCQTREIGVRMALGARRRDVLWLILKKTLALTLVGIALGVALALSSTRLIASLLFGLTPTDVTTLCSATLVMATVALLAGYLPARRASRVDPMVALRYE